MGTSPDRARPGPEAGGRAAGKKIRVTNNKQAKAGKSLKHIL
jgi:hypothetical protein